MDWLQLSLIVDKTNVDAVSDALTTAGAVAVTMQAADSQRILQLSTEPTPLWEHINLLALFTAETNQLQLQQQLATSVDFSTATWQTIVEADWLHKWHDYTKPMLFADKLWICPSWCEVPDPNALHVILDPEMAFGTGSHATTALCLDWLARELPQDAIVIDYGCGSGILGIAAAKLGAIDVLAVDNDPIALEVSSNNASNNNISAAIFKTYLPEQVPPTQADVLIANILAQALIGLAPTLAALLKPQGQLVLSGILPEQAAIVTSAYTEWFTNFNITQQDEWVRIHAVRSNIHLFKD